jgi:hypothetical protein
MNTEETTGRPSRNQGRYVSIERDQGGVRGDMNDDEDEVTNGGPKA